MKEGAAHVGYSAPLDYVLQLQPKYESHSTSTLLLTWSLLSLVCSSPSTDWRFVRNVHFAQFTLNRNLQVEKR